MTQTSPLICFYGDDFTGSTDALESLWLAGLSTTLFTQAPTRRRLAERPGLQAFGVAGMSRSMTPERMETELRPVLVALRETGTPIVHYKICSTFDSSPAVGNIGRAIEIGLSVFGESPIPIVAGAPSLGRYCVFGNLFARLGADGPVYRLDRHPSMSRHPITPMDEADLRLHLAKQTEAAIGLVTAPQLSNADAAFAANIDEGAKAILIDLQNEEQLPTVGRLIQRGATGSNPRMVIGSSGVGSAMAAYWHDSGIIKSPGPRAISKAAPAKSPILVVSGSCSPVSAAQVKHAAAQGFTDLKVDVNALLDPSTTVQTRKDLMRRAIASIEVGRSAVIHTSTSAAKGKTRHDSIDLGASIGLQLGRLIRSILNAAPIRRVVVAGGDTSGAIAVALGIESLDMVGTLIRGAPLCKATATGSPAHELEIVFKGGQVGTPDFFIQALYGVG